MDFRVPKPLHGWREFGGEVGIIVIGILIALSGDQLVDHFRQNAELSDAEQAMVSELRDDDLPQAFTREAMFACYDDQLSAIEKAVQSGDRDQALSLARTYQPVYRTGDDQAWQAALASQVLVHSGPKRMLAWSTAYVLIPSMDEGAKAEREELPHLHASLSGTGALSVAQQDRLLDTVSVLRNDNRSMSGGSLVLMKFAGDVGLKVTEAQKAALLADARRKFGACATDRSAEKLNLDTQLPTAADTPLRTN